MTSRLVFRLIVPLCMLACVSKYDVLSDYRSHNREVPYQSNRTNTFVILIDGLSREPLTKLLQENKLPALQKYFSANADSVEYGRAVFPTLTFPNMSSLLTKSPVFNHDVIGNSVSYDHGKTVTNFLSPSGPEVLTGMLRGKTIFKELSRVQRKNLGLSYSFNTDSSIKLNGDLKLGVQYMTDNFIEVDGHTINSLAGLLENTRYNAWPEFTFIHLVGFDGFSHRDGPNSETAKKYLVTLDSHLQKIFTTLEKAEQDGSKISVIVTSDHGMVDVSQNFAIEEHLQTSRLTSDLGIKVSVQDRLASLYFPDNVSESDRQNVAKHLATQQQVEIVAVQNGNEIQVFGREFHGKLTLSPGKCEQSFYMISFQNEEMSATPAQCPESWNDSIILQFNEYLLTQIPAYFNAKTKPHAVVIASKGVTFYSNNKGGHGGITDEEIHIPILKRNVSADFSDLYQYQILENLIKEEPQQQKPVDLPLVENESGFSKSVTKVKDKVFNRKDQRQFFGIDSRLSYIELNDHRANPGTNFHSTLGLALDLAYHVKRQPPWGYLFAYGFSFNKFNEIATTTPGQNRPTDIRHRFNFGSSYWLGSKSYLMFSGLAYQRPVLLLNSTGEATTTPLWFYGFEVGAKHRLFSLGIGDVLVNGGLGLNLPRQVQDVYFQTGLRGQAAIQWEYTLTDDNIGGFKFNVEGEHNRSSQHDQSFYDYGFGFYYQIIL